MGLLDGIKNLFGTAVNYQELIDSGAIIVDVRTPEEFDYGHIKGSRNIPLNKLNSKIKSLNSKEVILVCRSGARAAQAKAILLQNGIKAHNAGAWQNLK